MSQSNDFDTFDQEDLVPGIAEFELPIRDTPRDQQVFSSSSPAASSQGLHGYDPTCPSVEITNTDPYNPASPPLSLPAHHTAEPETVRTYNPSSRTFITPAGQILNPDGTPLHCGICTDQILPAPYFNHQDFVGAGSRTPAEASPVECLNEHLEEQACLYPCNHVLHAFCVGWWVRDMYAFGNGMGTGRGVRCPICRVWIREVRCSGGDGARLDIPWLCGFGGYREV